MLIYFSKRIAIPNQTNLNCISWNRDHGWIACGGESGLLKVLKLETPTGPDAKIMGIGAPSNLVMNQTLDGHNGNVMCVAWNPIFKKLTTSDEYGHIIVWLIHKGQWLEEMVNNRNKSVVRDMKWTSDGKKICIVYEDGAVIVGSVDGNRIWGKDLNFKFRLIEWSQDNKFILFVTADAEIIVFDAEGNELRKFSMDAVEDVLDGESYEIVSMHWFASSHSNKSSISLPIFSLKPNPNLLIALNNGTILLSRGEIDTEQIFFKTGLNITACKWDHSGNIIAVAGSSRKTSYDDKEGLSENLLKLYDSHGNFIRSLRVPGENISSLTWEGSGLRIALSVDSFIFFANIRPTYTWAFLLNTIVYAHSRRDRKESTVVFWDILTSELQTKIVNNLRFIVAGSVYCAIVWTEILSNVEAKENGEVKEIHHVQLRNSIGAVIDSKVIPFLPTCISMSSNYFIAANDRTIFSWHYNSVTSKLNTVGNAILETLGTSRIQSKVRLFDVESISISSAQPPETFKMTTDPIKDKVISISVSDKYLAIARKFGDILKFNVSHLNQENLYSTKIECSRIQFNNTSSKLAVIDINGTFSILDLECKVNDADSNALGPQVGKKLMIERKDVWDMCWAEDNEEMICIMEKNKMSIIRGETIEEPTISSGYLARFKDLEITGVSIDDLLAHAEQPSKDFIAIFETKTLRELRDLVIAQGLQAGYSFVENVPHKRLWRFLAEAALEEMNLDVAEHAFVRYKEYYGVQLVKQLKTMDKIKARAEIAVYLGKFDEAESIYLEIDRKDLAIAMYKKVGNYQRVIQLLQTGGGNDALIRDVFDKIGYNYADKFKWKKAMGSFEQSQNFDGLALCYYHLGNYKDLVNLKSVIPEGSSSLLTLAGFFESVGMHQDASDCYIKLNNDVKSAIDCCVALNRWDAALALAEQYDFPQVEGLLNRFASNLINNDKQLEAVELFRLANKPTEAALLIGDIADNAAKRELKPLFAKKLHVLAALEIERHRKQATDMLATQTTQGSSNATNQNLAQITAATLDTLMMSSFDTHKGTQQNTTTGKKSLKAFGSAWRGAMAYHFYMLSQRYFYSRDYDSAMKIAIKLCEYDDVLDIRDIYRLLALAAFKNKFYGVCSKAFVKLETLQSLSDVEREQIQQLAVNIFMKYTPSDPRELSDAFMKCLDVGKPLNACIVSGRIITEEEFITCRTCRGCIIEDERFSGTRKLLNCPVCHTPIKQ